MSTTDQLFHHTFAGRLIVVTLLLVLSLLLASVIGWLPELS